MSDVYRIFGAEISPYSVKVRSYFRYKGIPHEWIVRSGATQAEFQKPRGGRCPPRVTRTSRSKSIPAWRTTQSFFWPTFTFHSNLTP